MKRLLKAVFILALVLCFTIPASAIKILPYNVPLQDLMKWDKYGATLKISNPEGETLTVAWATTVDLWNYDGSTWTYDLPSGDTFAFGKAVTITGVLTVGVDDTGHDVKFYGATSGCYLEWDESGDALVTAGVAHLHLSGIDADAGEGVGSVIQMGTSGTPLTSAEDETEGISCYFESSGKNIYGMRMQVEKTSATAGAPRALTLRSILSHDSGFAPQGANAVDARVTLETGNTGISGEMHAMESQCRVDSESRTVQGTYAAHKFTNRFRTDNTMPANTTFFVRFRDDGEVKTPTLFELSGHTTGEDNLFSTTPSDKTNGNVNATLKIIIGGTTYWIPLWDVKDGS